MAGASMKDIKTRIRSVESTMQITKAMQLVASSKLRQARMRMENSRDYFNVAKDVVMDIAAHRSDNPSPFAMARAVQKRCYVVVAGDRGLAGSYNANVFKAVEAHRGEVPYCVATVGRKAREYFMRRDVAIIASEDRAEGLSVEDCKPLAKALIQGFEKGDFDEVVLIYTHFVSVLTQEPRMERLLPVICETVRKGQMICEPGEAALIRHFLPQYLSGMIYSAVCDAFASEQAARRVAMDSATKNAGQMIDDLSLRYNRARQGSITQELTEIVAGAEQ